MFFWAVWSINISSLRDWLSACQHLLVAPKGINYGTHAQQPPHRTLA